VTSTEAAILTDLCETVRATGAFAAVTIGPDADSARWPRAEILFESLRRIPAEDRADAFWCALTARVRISLRLASGSADPQRALDLAETVGQALLVDRFRGQRCRDLPIGRATELGPTQLKTDLKQPYLAASFEVRCHFESQEQS